MDYLAAIDIGSTRLKAGIFDAGGRPLAVAARPTEPVHPGGGHPDWVVWDPEQIWGGAADACREAVSHLEDPARLRAVAVTGMGMDGVPVDADGRILYPFISWHDPRTAPQAAWWRKTVGAERTFAITGLPVWHFEAVMRMLWMREHEPAIFARTATWLLIVDFLNFRLCGARVTDPSMASCFLLLDQRRREWSEALLEAARIPRALLPDVRPAGTPIGAVSAAAAARTGLPAGTPVVLGGQDHLCGTLPVGAHRPGRVMNVIGTWDNLVSAVAEPVLVPAVRDAAVCMQAHVAPGVHGAWCGTMAGECLGWFRRVFGEGATDGDAARADAPPGAGGVLFLPHLAGAACPVADAGARGAFAGLSAAATRDDLLQAVVEGINFQFRDMLEALQAGLGVRFDRIAAGGGGAGNAFWIQNRADVTGLPIDIPEIADATLLGAAMLAGVGAGVYRDLDEAYRRVAGPVRTVSPRPERTAAYADVFSRYRRLYPALAAARGGRP